MSGAGAVTGEEREGRLNGLNWAHRANQRKMGPREVRPGGRFTCSPVFFGVPSGFDFPVVVNEPQEVP